MKIGLIRHFRVDLKRRRMMTSVEYNEHVYNYDFADVIPNEIVIDEEWDKCYCSTLPRAVATAKTVYHGKIIFTDKLIEIPSAARFNFSLRLPYNLWAIIGRFAWIRNHISQPEGRKKTIERITDILDTILEEKDQNILIVSHAGTLYEIQKLLKRKGFTGDKFFKARNGKLYIYRK
jgi:broad specificity phosphatase PhoE